MSTISNPHWPTNSEPANDRLPISRESLKRKSLKASTSQQQQQQTGKLPKDEELVNLKPSKLVSRKPNNNKPHAKQPANNENPTTSAQSSDFCDDEGDFEGGFKLFLRRIQKYASQSKFSGKNFEIDDVDFVFIVDKPPSGNDKAKKMKASLSMAGCSASCYEFVSENMADLRMDYLKALQQTYKISYQVVEGKTHDYYLIHLSFYHLGLLAEITRYQWQLKTKDPSKVAYKNLSFFKWPIGNIEEFQNCRSRKDFPSALRFDLAYQFLVNATVNMDSPEQRPSSSCSCCPAVASKPTEYNLLRVMADKIFDNWLIPHDPIPVRTKRKVEKYLPGCMPCIDSCTYAGEDMHDSTPELKHGESIRSFLCRYCTMKTAITKHNFPQNEQEKAVHAHLWHIIPVNYVTKYAGEKIGFYFAWAELLTMSLVVPAVIGAALFIGFLIYYAIEITNNQSDHGVSFEEIGKFVQYVLVKTCDNYATPGFAILMIIWGTVFHEVWTRREAWYRFMWNVEDLDIDELELITREPPTETGELHETQGHDRSKTRYLFYFVSMVVTAGFILLVFLSVYVINVIHVFSFDYCPTSQNSSSTTTTTTTTPSSRRVFYYRSRSVSSSSDSFGGGGYGVESSTFDGSTDYLKTAVCQLFAIAQVMANSISLFVLNIIYTKICYKLTDWECHARPSHYTNALILKLFVFRFFNYYSILFFTAFANNVVSLEQLSAIIGGKSFQGQSDGSCGDQPCLMKLTKQLLGILVTQPIFNTIAGLVLPSVNAIIQTIKQKTSNVVGHDDSQDDEEAPRSPEREETKLGRELDEQSKLLHLSTLGRQEFTADEFSMRVITYGALLMFSVALPPAPALALIIMRIDLTLDIRRIMTRYKRPIPLRDDGIGLWNDVVSFLTYLGIVTNPLILVLTSTWGSRYDTWTKFWIFIGFEHLAFLLRAFVAAVIPDEPGGLQRQKLRRKIVKQELLEDFVQSKRL